LLISAACSGVPPSTLAITCKMREGAGLLVQCVMCRVYDVWCSVWCMVQGVWCRVYAQCV
jgi:hypothetical protein